MKVVLTGGGTGGHIYPALTIAAALRRSMPDTEVLFIGTSHGLEADIVPKSGYPFKTITVQGFVRKKTLANVGTIFKLAASFPQAWRILREFRPDAVIGTGGYVCGPVVLTAALLGIPTLIQEQNVIPGVTNRILARFADCVALGYEETAKHFPGKARIVVTGNPVREEILTASRERGQAALNLRADRLTVLVAGGSRGARSINTAMLDVYRLFASDDRVQFLHVTGQNEYTEVVGKIKQLGIKLTTQGTIIVKPYLYNMPDALAAADLVVYRAGAIGLAEITLRGLPAILIPYPFAAENHQEYNARVLERAGAAVVITDRALTGAKLAETINTLVSDPEKLRAMAVASKRLGKPAAVKQIIEQIQAMVTARHPKNG